MNTTTAPSGQPYSRAAQLAHEAHSGASADCLGYYNSDSMVTLLTDSDDLAVLGVCDVLDAGRPVGVTAHIPLEALTWIGLDVSADIGVLELTGSREEIAKAAALFAEVGAKLQAHVAESLTERVAA